MTATVFTEQVEAYLAIRRALGHKLITHGRLLEEFTSYLTAHDHVHVTIDAAISWASAGTEADTHRIALRLSAVRGFASYLAAFDPDTQIPPAHLVPTAVRRRTPYIFSAAEIDSLISAASRLTPQPRAEAFATLIGLMAATGLRTAEARRLDRGDVDLATGMLAVRYSKYGKSRYLPLDPTTTGALADYVGRRDTWCPHPPTEAFLICPRGQRLVHVGATFTRLLAVVGITVTAGRRTPRLHDLRHAFAVTTLRDWHAAGLDVQSRLPLLSLYLGHVNPAHTYWYLQAVPELMSVLADRLEVFLEEPS